MIAYPLQRLEQVDPSDLAKTYFDHAHTYLLGAGAPNFPTPWHSIPTVTFASDAAMQKAFASHTIPASVKAVVYDNEAWSFTPAQEQRQPGRYDQLAAELVHEHHLIFIATPATDLAHVINPAGGNSYQNFLRLGIAGAAARYADIYEIQAQGSELHTSTYVNFVRQAAEQARAANAHVIVLAGLSTNPGGQHVTGEDLYRAVMATQSMVSGYWLNIPAGGRYCPRCGTPQPQVAIDFLKRLSGQDQ
ncbi:MAG: hypothetical protein IMW90_17690 [Thermogemmatispora sp.]|uniref:hypothetical protein n=1 Tax=Thermogemmatispora sp. TaxID=1968838 RepID=UPI001A09C63C|nr:hypothetical protein [Thermogemmatispora sp.]MBE3567550.1 hypothetical protein [Thermogemmatispora sp.]